MKPLRIVFVEDDQVLAKQLKPHYEMLLNSCGYTVSVQDAIDETQTRALILTFDPHVIICDLGLDNDYEGLHVIRNIRKEFPDLFVIGTSRAECSTRLVDARQPSFHMFIDKQSLLGGQANYLSMMRKRFLELFLQDTAVRIVNINNLHGEEFGTEEGKREISALLRQIIFSSHNPDELMHPDEVVIEPLSGGFSGSQVFKMQARNGTSGIVSVPGVLKVSKLEYSEQELDNYRKFVKWGLPYTWRVDLLGYGATLHYGAIAYSFIMGGGATKFESLSELLRRKDDRRVLSTITALFSPEMRRWYGDPLIQHQNNLVDRYVSRYFRGEESQELSQNEFNRVVQTNFGGRFDRNKIQIGDSVYETPGPALFGHPIGQYQSCICHGDLNSNNVMVAENEQIIFIDFQETGRGHVFEDFVTMEASARLYHGDGGPNGQALLDNELAIGNGDDVSGFTGAQRIAAEIRKLARDNFRSEPFENYFFACAVFHYRLLRVPLLSPRQKQRIVATVLACVAQLTGSRTALAVARQRKRIS